MSPLVPLLLPVEEEGGEVPLRYMGQPERCSTLGRNLRRRGDNGREGGRGASDIELLGLGEDVNPSGVDLDQINLETLAGGPTTGRAVHSGSITGGEDLLLQSDVEVRGRLLWEPKHKCRQRVSVNLG